MLMLNKNTWGIKKCEANQKQHCKQAGVTKYQLRPRSYFIKNTLNDMCTIVYSIFSQVCVRLTLSLSHLYNQDSR